MKYDKLFNDLVDTSGKLNSKLSQLAGSATVFDLKAKKNIKGDFGNGDWKYEAGLQAAAGVQVLASKTDKDTDNIFGEAAKAESTDAGPLLHPTPNVAWLKYSLAWQGSAEAGTKRGPAKLEFSGTANASLGAYCPSPASTQLKAALSQGSGIPFVFDAGEIRGLEVGQAAFVAVGGTLSAKLEFNWADVLTSSLKPLQRFASGNAPVNLSIDLKAGFAAEFSISDSFRLVFLGADADYVTVVLNRASSNAFAVTAGVSASIRLEKPDMARDVLANLAAQLLGVDRARLASARAELEKIVSFYDDAIGNIRSKIGNLAGKLDAAIDAQGLPLLLTRLQQLQALAKLADGNNPGANAIGATVAQISTVASSIDELADRLATEVGDKLDDLLTSLNLPTLAAGATAAARGLLERIEEIESKLLAIAKKRIEVGLSFEYRRIATDATVLRARLRRTDDRFSLWHGSLISLDATRVLAASTPTNRDVILDLFLNERSIKRSMSLGLDLGWLYTDKDTAKAEWTTTKRMVSGASIGAPLLTERRSTLKGSRSREEKIFGSVCACSGQFDANFQAKGDTDVAGEWNFALALSYASSALKADRSWLLALADYAVVWGVIPESQINSLIRILEGDGAIGSRVEVEIGYTLDRTAWANPKLFKAIAQASDGDMQRALAVALQRVDGHPERATPSLREATYTDSMKVMLGKASIDVTKPALVAKYVAKHLQNASDELERYESASPIEFGSVASIVKYSRSFLGDFKDFRLAGQLASLAGVQAMGGDSDRELVEDAFEGWDVAWRNRILLRWQVTLLRRLVAREGLATAAASTMKVKVGTKGKARIF